MGLNFYAHFLRMVSAGEKNPGTIKDVVRHARHIVNIGGIEVLGIGSDFDGIEVAPSGLEDISALPVLFDELRGRGYAETDLEKLASGNFFRIMCQD